MLETEQAPPRRLYLLGGFELHEAGEVVDMPAASQRVLAFLALQQRRVSRPLLAGTLWPETTDARAGANLRSALWRLRRPGHDLLTCTPTHLALHDGVWVDARESARASRALLDGGEPVPSIDPRCFGDELLPDLWDGWLVIERERVRQLHLHALERVCLRLTEQGDLAQAILAGITAVEMDPLRESANRILIQAHLAEGNRVEAIRQFDAYRRLLAEELGLLPSAELFRLTGIDAAAVMPP
ncbi:MAG: SARP family transcriptional regulator [Acidimicrobiia bacterium]|jgi:DNA-binding SARP family transcriptional activator|nr:SARP family transcriptional regulator [Acidimicrobiia bacterium]